MKCFLAIIFILTGSTTFAQQDFEFEGRNRIKFSNLQANSINIDVTFKYNRHCSVKLITTDKNGNTNSRLIKDNENVPIDPSQMESFIIVHKKKFIIRVPQKIKVEDDSTIKPKSSKRNSIKDLLRLGRVRLSSQSAGGTTTSTTVTST